VGWGAAILESAYAASMRVYPGKVGLLTIARRGIVSGASHNKRISACP
jgi:hypothetical protein